MQVVLLLVFLYVLFMPSAFSSENIHNSICTSSPCNIIAADNVELSFQADPGVVRWNFKDLTQVEEGMSLNNSTGVFTWTPTNNQASDTAYIIQISGYDENDIELQTQQVSISVQPNNNIDWSIIKFVSTTDFAPTVANQMDGSMENPYSLDKFGTKYCVDGAVINETIYFRGGVHTTAIGDNPATLFCSGSSLDEPLILKPWGNEKPVLSPKGTEALKILGNFVTVDGFEIAGHNDQITIEKALDIWWDEDLPVTPEGYSIIAQGILAKGDGIVIKNNIVHSWPGNGIKVQGDLSTIENNIVFNSGYFSTRGVGGVMVSDLNNSSIPLPAGREFGTIVRGNLIFSNESRIISHVFSKGFSTLEIDEGSGINLQQNKGDYTRKYLVENNAILFNGKGPGLRSKDITFRNNTVIGNGYNLRIPSTAGIRLQVISTSGLATIHNGDAGATASVINNLISVPPNHEAIRIDAASRTTECTNNTVQGMFIVNAKNPSLDETGDPGVFCSQETNNFMVNSPVKNPLLNDYSQFIEGVGAEQTVITNGIVRLNSIGRSLKPSGFDIMSIHDYENYIMPMVNTILSTVPKGDQDVVLTYKDGDGVVINGIDLTDQDYSDLLSVERVEFSWTGSIPEYKSGKAFADDYYQVLKPALDDRYAVIGMSEPWNAGVIQCTEISIRTSKVDRSTSCTPTPNTGYKFTGWTGACNGESCSIPEVNNDVSITANFVAISEPSTQDADGDGVSDNNDNCPNTPLNSSVDTTGCSESERDSDSDGINDDKDTYPLISIGNLTDTDSDGAPDTCDEACVALGMAADTDDDNDGVLDTFDAYSLISIGNLTDTDSDGAPDICDDACQALGMSADTDIDTANVVSYEPKTCSNTPCSILAADFVEITQDSNSEIVKWSLVDETQYKLGMRLNSQSGVFTWTPTNHQTGSYTIDIQGLSETDEIVLTTQIIIDVESNAEVDWENILFISPGEYAPNRTADMTGSMEQPYSYDAFGSRFCKDSDGNPVTSSQTVYFRGGIHTTSIGDNPAAIFCNGESLDAPFVLTAWGNERPVLSPKGTEGIKIQGDFVKVSGLEFAGYIDKISLADAVADWWWEERPATPEGYIITAQGILAKGRGIVIHNNLVHSWPGNAVKIEGDLSSMLDNVVFNSGYYSTRGVGGVMVEGLNDSELAMPADRDFGIIIKNNVVFGNESRIISHVFSKDFSTLEIDEGSAMNLQQNGGDYTRGYLVENNAFLYNGKGVGLRAKNVVFRDNTVYGNGLNIRAPGASGVRATKITTGSLASVFNGDAGSIATVINNVIAVPANQEAISVDNVSRISGGCSSNLIQGIIDDDNQDCGLSENVVLINDPVLDASSLDFSPLLGNAGAEQSLITGTIVKLASYGYELKPSGFDIMSIHDYDEYVLPMINEILKTTPEGDGGVELTFEDANGSVVTTVNLDDNNYEDLLDVATIKFDWLGTKPKYDSKNRFAGSYEQYIKAAPDPYYSVIATVSPVGSGYVTCSDISIRSTKNQRQVSCEAVPLDGYTFTSWSGDCSGDTCDIESVNGDVSLIAVFDSKLSETDTDNDGIPDIRDDDDDNDGVLDTADAYPLISIGELMDTDSDGAPNTCDEACVALGMLADTDDDDDGVVDLDDAFPIDPLESLDSDSDGLGDNYEVTNNLNAFDADSDADGLEDGTEIALGTNPLSNDSDFDGVLDGRDKYPLISLSGLADSDGDGAPDECDDSCLALGMMADRDGVPPYTLLEQPQPQFASLTPTAKVIVTGSDGENFFDIARYVDVVSMVGQTFLVSGSSSIDGFRVMPGVKYDLTNLKGSVDTLYFSGPLSEYAGSILLDSSTGVMQLSRLTDIGEEVVQFIASNTAADVLVFSDGAISTSEVKTAVLNNTDLTTLTLDTSVSAMDDKVTTGAQVKHIILDNDGAGAMALGPNIQTLISGSSGVDQIYVPEGSVVDASNLKSGQDEVYVQGDLADYDKAFDTSGNIILTREVTIDTETYTESIKVANGGNPATNDLIIFADQQLDAATLKREVVN